MADYTLTLRRRKAANTIEVDLNIISQLVKSGDKETLFQLFQDTVVDPTVHDVYWLKLIINWVPPDGLPLTEMMKWARLAEIANQVNTESDEVDVKITEQEARMIAERLRDPNFKVRNFSYLFTKFIQDFQTKTGLEI